jgi:hypothetical protein
MGDFLSKIFDLIFPGNRITFFKLVVIVSIISIVLPIALNYFYENIKKEQEIRIL